MEVMTLVSHISGLVCFYWSIWVHPKSQVYWTHDMVTYLKKPKHWTQQPAPLSFLKAGDY
jgi:hypothetical protein